MAAGLPCSVAVIVKTRSPLGWYGACSTWKGKSPAGSTWAPASASTPSTATSTFEFGVKPAPAMSTVSRVADVTDT